MGFDGEEGFRGEEGFVGGGCADGEAGSEKDSGMPMLMLDVATEVVYGENRDLIRSSRVVLPAPSSPRSRIEYSGLRVMVV